MTTLPTALSLFSGAGGLDLGAKIAGVSVKLASDAEVTALNVLSNNLGTPTLEGKLEDLVSSGTLAQAWKGSPPDLLIGGPPCTAFSHAGFWLDYKRSSKDRSASTLYDYVDTIALFKPRAVIIENVPGLLFKNHKHRLDSVTRQLKRLGYKVGISLLSAEKFGVAQKRKRVFIIGTQSKVNIDLDSWPSFPTRTSEWAFRGLNELNQPEYDEIPAGKYSELLQQVPPGANYLVHTEQRGAKNPVFKYRGRYWSFLLKLDPKSPSSTIPAQRVTWNGPFHWSSRHLRVRELARLQSFPDDFQFSSNLTDARRQIGNAVPVILAAAVTWKVCRSLGTGGNLPDCLKLLMRHDTSYADIQATFPKCGQSLASIPV